MELEPQPQVPAEEVDDAPEGSVTIRFGISVPCESDPSTKALGEDFELKNLYLAVFGGSGYYKQYEQAHMIGEPKKVDMLYKTYKDNEGHDVNIYKSVWSYQFRANLNLSNTPRTIHFLGNMPTDNPIDIGYARDVLPGLLCTEETAFWQMITLDHITARVDKNGQFVDTDPLKEGIQYEVSEETADAFSANNGSGGIALIRNWAKIVLRNNYPEQGNSSDAVDWAGSHFTPYTFAVINYPSRGTVVPYGGTTGFIADYHLKSFDQLYKDPDPSDPEDTNLGYKGNLTKTTLVDPFYDNPDDPDDVPLSNLFFEDPDNNPDPRVKKYNPTYDPEYEGYDASTEYKDDEPAVYLYERPVPSDDMPPSYVIVYGHYYNPDDKTLNDDEKRDGVDCYYKIDLMSGGAYYPIFRNFKYQINLWSISAKGHTSAEEAALAAGSADVSADITASHLPDISDGTRRMVVQHWMSKAFYKSMEPDEQLHVVFYDDINDVDRNNDGNTDGPKFNMGEKNVWTRLIPDDGSVVTRRYDNQKNDISVELGNPVAEDGSDYGFRSITFGINSPGSEIRTQTLRIYCQSNLDDSEETPMYRDVILTLMPIQTMRISFSQPRILRYKDQEQVVNIRIPAGLPESMFPLDFRVEPQRMTLTPDTSKESLPVMSGKSLADDKSPVFYFIKTITWEEYKATRAVMDLEDEAYWGTSWCSFPCYFKTNYEYSGTEVYVSNEYFYTTHAAFSDYRSFKTAAFTTAIPNVAGRSFSVQASVEIEPDGTYEKVYVDCRNAELDSDTKAKMMLDDTDGRWYYQPVDSNPFTLSFLTTADSSTGDVKVTLSAKEDEFEPVVLTPWHFSNVGFIDAHKMPDVNGKDSNVAFGRVNNDGGKYAHFGYSVDPRNPKPSVSIKKTYDNANMNVNVSGSNPVNLANNTRSGSYTGDENFYWFTLTTVKNTNLVQFLLSAVGYVDYYVSAGRFSGQSSIYTLDLAPNKFTPSESSVSVKEKKREFNIDCWFTITFSSISAVTSEGIVLAAGGTYEFEIETWGSNGTAATNCELFYVELDYASDANNLPKKPALALPLLPEEFGNHYSNYLGDRFEYIWSLPRGVKMLNTAKLKMIAPTNQDIVIKKIRIKAFRGNFTDE